MLRPIVWVNWRRSSSTGSVPLHLSPVLLAPTPSGQGASPHYAVVSAKPGTIGPGRMRPASARVCVRLASTAQRALRRPFRVRLAVSRPQLAWALGSVMGRRAIPRCCVRLAQLGSTHRALALQHAWYTDTSSVRHRSVSVDRIVHSGRLSQRAVNSTVHSVDLVASPASKDRRFVPTAQLVRPRSCCVAHENRHVTPWYVRRNVCKRVRALVLLPVCFRDGDAGIWCIGLRCVSARGVLGAVRQPGLFVVPSQLCGSLRWKDKLCFMVRAILAFAK